MATYAAVNTHQRVAHVASSAARSSKLRWPTYRLWKWNRHAVCTVYTYAIVWQHRAAKSCLFWQQADSFFCYFIAGSSMAPLHPVAPLASGERKLRSGEQDEAGLWEPLVDYISIGSWADGGGWGEGRRRGGRGRQLLVPPFLFPVPMSTGDVRLAA